MKIHGGKPPERSEVVRFQKSGKNEALEVAGKGGVSDKVAFSGKAREIAEIMGAVRTMPEVRAEKVAEIRGLIEDGKYAVDPAKVAQRMIDEIV